MKFFDRFRSKKATIPSLPAEMLTNVLRFLDGKQLAQARRISHLYNQLIKNDKDLQRMIQESVPVTYTYRFLLVGHVESQQLSLLKDFSKPDPTELGIKWIGLNFGSKSLQIQAYDIAEQVQYLSVMKTWLKESAGVLLVFNLENQITFDEVASLHQTSKELAPNVPIVLVGTLINPQNIVVDRNAIEAFANMHKLPYVEVNIMDQSQVEQAFKTLGQKVLEQCARSTLPMLEPPKQEPRVDTVAASESSPKCSIM
jgi:GTPase SAR1 family protein